MTFDEDNPDEVVDLDEFRNWKKQLTRSKRVHEDLTTLIRILLLTSKGLSLYSKYTPIKELIDIINTDVIILKSHQKRHRDIIDREKKKK